MTRRFDGIFRPSKKDSTKVDETAAIACTALLVVYWQTV